MIFQYFLDPILLILCKYRQFYDTDYIAAELNLPFLVYTELVICGEYE